MQYNNLIFIVFYFVYLIFNVLENYYRDAEKFNIGDAVLARRYQKQWKKFQFLQWALVFVIIMLLLKFPIILITKLIIIAGLLWIFLYDGLLNVLRKRNFFYVSTQTASVIEQKITKYIRKNFVISIILLIVLIVLKILLLFVWR